MASLHVIGVTALLFTAVSLSHALGQQAIASPANDGSAATQNEAAIEQARFYRDANGNLLPQADANTNSVAEVETSSFEDDSFGAQKILKTQERPTYFTVSGGVSIGYTNNVALTRRATKSDVLAVADAGITWSAPLTGEIGATLGLHTSVFRYDKTTAFDFTNIGLGGGLIWTPKFLYGASLVSRYDFTELLDRDGREILRDHAISLGLQKAISLGRSHGFTLGVNCVVDFSDPDTAQRDQFGASFGYHVALTRKLDADIFYRPAANFYPNADRTDFNQIMSLSIRYHLAPWADLNATGSYGFNRSNHAPFDYEVLNSNCGLSLNVAF